MRAFRSAAAARTRPIKARRELTATTKPRKPKMTELGVTSGTGATLVAAVTPQILLLLVRTATDWGWETKTTDLLWALSKHPEKQKDAFLALYRHYSRTADTQGLYRALLCLFEMAPF
jgi:hypothetical protein